MKRIAKTRLPITMLVMVALASITPLMSVGAEETSASSSSQPNPYARPDDSWITISGIVKDVKPDAFTLHYGKGSIIVEMDDGDRDADGYKLVTGDKVIVNGKIDDDFFQRTTIEAGSVYVEKLGTYFWASPEDEEDPRRFLAPVAPIVLSEAVLQGTVTEVGESQFTLDTGHRRITVDVDEMAYNPLDDKGYQKIEVGDVVRASGRLDFDLFEGREFEARSIIKMAQG